MHACLLAGQQTFSYTLHMVAKYIINYNLQALHLAKNYNWQEL